MPGHRCLTGHFTSLQHKKTVIATTALGMGVNFLDVKYIVHADPERSLVDYNQAAGRAGRNGQCTHDIVIYHGNQLAQCSLEVKEFVHYSNISFVTFNQFNPFITVVPIVQ